MLREPTPRIPALAAVAVLVALAGCNKVGFDFVSIEPTYGYADGCTDVKIGGHGFSKDISGTIGGNAITDIVLPDENSKDRLEQLNVGFQFTGLSPAGEGGFAEVSVDNGDGEPDSIKDAWYYISCPGAPYPEALGATDVAVGDSVLILGCGMDTSLKVRLDPVGATTGAPVGATAALTSVCSTARVSFDVPAGTAPGSYLVNFVDGSGTLVYGDNLCDTADTGGGCQAPLVINVGGA